MKARTTLLAIPLIVGVAFAQSTSGSAGQSQGSSSQSQPQSGSQQDRTGQTGQTGQADRTGQAGQTGSQADRTGQTGQTGSQAGSSTGTPAAGMSGQPAEMKTMTYKGTLVDLACGSSGASASAARQPDTNMASRSAGQTGATGSAGSSQAGSSAAGSSTAGSSTAGGSMAGAAGSANRSASGGDCPVTANSTQLGLKMDNGQVVRFDLVGNQRAQDGLKTNKGWNKNMTNNKPVKVKISGILQGDKLIVSSIN
jgi:hypothetical protein